MVTANQVTIATCALSVGIGWFVAFYARYRGWLLPLPVFLLIRMALNASASAHDYAPKIRCMVLAAPIFFLVTRLAVTQHGS